MNTWQLAEDFRQGAIGTDGFVEAEFVTGQNQGDLPSNAAIFSATDEPFSADGKTGRFILTVTVRTHAADATAGAHAARVKAMQDNFRGNQASWMSFFDTLAHFRLIGFSALPEEGGTERSAFETPIRFAGTAVEL
jgi:hypothetical protein